jgi:hypothetical protein
MKMKYVFMFVVVALLVAVCQTQAAFLVAEQGGNVQNYSGSGSFLGTFATGFLSPIGVAEGGGNVFVSDLTGSYIYKYSASGTPLGVINNAAVTGGHQPAGIAWSDNRINGAAYGINYLTSHGPDAGAEDGLPGTPLSYLYYGPSVSTIHGVASANPNGYTGVYFTYSSGTDGSGGLGYWDPGVMAIDSIFTVVAGSTPRGVVTDGSGNLFVALNGTGTIMKRDSVGTVTTWKTGLDSPVGLAVDGGNLYVGSFNGKTITGYSLSTGSQVSSFATLSSPQYFTVTAIPEPMTVSILGLGMLGLLRRKRN